MAKYLVNFYYTGFFPRKFKNLAPPRKIQKNRKIFISGIIKHINETKKNFLGDIMEKMFEDI